MALSERLKRWEPVIERHIKRLYKYLDRQEKSRNSPYFIFCVGATYWFGATMGFVLGLMYWKLSALTALLVTVLPYGH